MSDWKTDSIKPGPIWAVCLALPIWAVCQARVHSEEGICAPIMCQNGRISQFRLWYSIHCILDGASCGCPPAYVNAILTTYCIHYDEPMPHKTHQDWPHETHQDCREHTSPIYLSRTLSLHQWRRHQASIAGLWVLLLRRVRQEVGFEHWFSRHKLPVVALYFRYLWGNLGGQCFVVSHWLRSSKSGHIHRAWCT